MFDLSHARPSENRDLGKEEEKGIEKRDNEVDIIRRNRRKNYAIRPTVGRIFFLLLLLLVSKQSCDYDYCESQTNEEEANKSSVAAKAEVTSYV